MLSLSYCTQIFIKGACFYRSASLRCEFVDDGVRGGRYRSLWGCGGQAPVIDSQIGALILEDLAFPLRHNNALCAALPVSQAWEEGTGRLSHGSHRFLPPSPVLPQLPNFRQCCVLHRGKMTAPSASQQDAAELFLDSSRKGSGQT